MLIKQGLEEEYTEYKKLNESDPYSARVVSYSEDWANLMEEQLAKGQTIEFIAKEMAHIADTDGISGFMYGASVSALAHFWVHGEALRRWHNKDVQIGNEGDKANESGGVLNPALLVIDTSDDEVESTND